MLWVRRTRFFLAFNDAIAYSKHITEILPYQKQLPSVSWVMPIQKHSTKSGFAHARHTCFYFFERHFGSERNKSFDILFFRQSIARLQIFVLTQETPKIRLQSGSQQTRPSLSDGVYNQSINFSFSLFRNCKLFPASHVPLQQGEAFIAIYNWTKRERKRKQNNCFATICQQYRTGLHGPLCVIGYSGLNISQLQSLQIRGSRFPNLMKSANPRILRL